MSALEIVAMVVLCLVGMTIVMLFGQVMILIDRIANRYYEKEKKPSSELTEGNKKQEKKPGEGD